MPEGGIAPYHWSILKGALPDGLALDEAGAVKGTPTTAGEFKFTVHVNDSGKDSAELTIGVQA